MMLPWLHFVTIVTLCYLGYIIPYHGYVKYVTKVTICYKKLHNVTYIMPPWLHYVTMAAITHHYQWLQLLYVTVDINRFIPNYHFVYMSRNMLVIYINSLWLYYVTICTTSYAHPITLSSMSRALLVLGIILP